VKLHLQKAANEHGHDQSLFLLFGDT